MRSDEGILLKKYAHVQTHSHLPGYNGKNSKESRMFIVVYRARINEFLTIHIE